MKTPVLHCTFIFISLLFYSSVYAQLPGCHAKFAFEIDQQNLTVTFNDSSWYDVGPQNTTWFWDFGDGNYSQNQNIVHTYPIPETYVICLTVTNCSSIPGACCSDTYCDTIQWGKYVPTFVSTLLGEEVGDIFPNPFGSTVALQLSPLIQEVVIYEMHGREVARYPVLTHTLMLETAFLPDGIYWLQFLGENGIIGRRQIVKG